ncbi:MAG TPA: tetratricopeptide repeat protein, partial [Gemmataceae bacterium]|nr:tetratricopeptide repeat protein [Gemmataceae bacterium]
VEQPVIVADPGVPVLQSINPPLIPQATGPAPAPPAAVGPTLPPPAAVEKPQAEPEADFAARGQEQFLAGKYADAVKSLRHAVLDDPKNGPLLALTGEALWAAGNFNEAAGAFQQSLLATPEADWKAVAHRAARLTPADSVTALGNALVKEEQPSLRFLAAYQSFGAGKWEEATAHLDVVLKKAPDDQVAKKLRELAVKASEGK